MTAISAEERLQWVGASESYKWIGQSPYGETPYDLWAEKTGRVPPKNLEDNPVVKWGQWLEPAIIAHAHEAPGNPWLEPLVNVPDYWKHPSVPMMGCSPDTIGRHQKFDTWGVVDIKLTGGATLKEDGRSPWYWQVQHQIACSGAHFGEPATWGGICALVHDGRRLETRVWIWDRDDDDVQQLEEGVRNFAALIASGEELNPADYGGQTIKPIPPPADVITVDSLGPEQAMQASMLMSDAYRDNLQIKQLQTNVKEAYEALVEIGEGASIRSPLYQFTRTAVKASEGTLVTPDMVGTHIGGRKSYVRQSIKEIKQ